jgi:signal transduction histidine kinase
MPGRLLNLRIARSLRAKVLLVIVFGVVVPLAIVGLWLTRATERSGRALLRARLDASLAQVVNEVSARWIVVRSGLLDIAEAPEVRGALDRGDGSTSPPETSALRMVVHSLGDDAGDRDGPTRFVLRDRDSTARWVLTRVNDSTLQMEPANAGTAPASGIRVSLPVTLRGTGEPLGTIETQLATNTLVPVGAGGTGGIGAVLGINDRANGEWLAPLPFDPALLAREEFNWAGEQWLVARRALEEPYLLLAAAASLGGFSAPFEGAARNGAIALLIVSMATLALAALLTRRLTQSLERLAVAADAVSQGDLEHRANVPDDDEVGRVARAFNGMVENLRQTLDRLARRERLAAVGEFAASLAHEVRNPLTSLRMDLQRLEEQVPADSTLRLPLERALRVVTRLNHTVSGALRVARSGTGGTDLVNLRLPIQRALEVTMPAFEQAGTTLEAPDSGAAPLLVRGDPSALEQLFLNLLLNAAEATSAGGRVTVSAAFDGDEVEVSIRDSGHGIPAALLGRVFDPFVSTKPEGTGLGLAIARQIAIAHGGELSMESESGAGATARLRLPRATPSGDQAT